VKHGSLFTGVGGIDLGFDSAGIETVWQCEINKQCRSVLAKHWPDAVRYEDVTTVDGAAVTPVDVITFGSPCQDLSIAGRRAGFQDGTRSNLYFEAIRIIKEMRHASENQYPRYAIWENVRGALSSNGGADFLAAIQALADLGAVDISWRVVNTCHFGPPQRRVRVFVVADFGGERAGEILSQPTRVLWHPATGGATGKETSGDAEERVGVGGWFTERKVVDALTIGGWYDTQEACSGRLVYSQSGPCGSRVRRLTPKECERLQGWPDDHTRWADSGKELADSARYKMCGNGVSAPVAQWIGENLMDVTEGLS
jgi:DNA (cytosine-5)-methyltransferase 1